MGNEKRISIKTALLAAVLMAAAAFHAAAEQFKAAAEAAQATSEAAKADKEALASQLADANTQLGKAHVDYAAAQEQLAAFQNEEKLEDHPELVSQINALGVVDGEIETPAADLPPTDPNPVAGDIPPLAANGGTTTEEPTV
jgi:hypothetical protein